MKGCGCGLVPRPVPSSGSPFQWLLKTVTSHNTVNHILLTLI